MSLLENTAVKRVEKSLIEFDDKLKIIVLDNTARTAIEAASSLGCEVGAIIKSLLFRTNNDFTLCLIAGDKKASLNKIKKILGIEDALMASPEEVKNITGFTIGGVSPIGHLIEKKVLIDNSLERFVDLFAAAGHPNCIFKINFKDLQKLTTGSIENITE